MPPFARAASYERSKDFKKSFKFLFKKFRPFRFAVGLSFVLSVLGTVLSIMGPYVLNLMQKEILVLPFNFSKIEEFGIILALMYAFSFGFGYIENFIMAKVSTRISQSFRTDITKKINSLPLSYFDKHSYGDLLSRMTNDVDLLGQTLNSSIPNFITSATMIIGIPIMMFTISWELTLFSLIEVPLALGLIMLIVKFSQKYFIRNQRFLGDINGHIEEIYSAHNVVKAFNGEQKAMDKFDTINIKLRNAGRKSQFLSSLMMPTINFIGNIIYAGVCVLGAWIAIENNDLLFVTNIVTFLTYIRIFNQPIAQFGSIFSTFQSAMAASERIMEFLDEKNDSPDTGHVKLKKVKGKVEFRNVSFGYDKDNTIIHNFSFTALPGQKIAIVGPTGAGKTTLVNLLMRFYDIDEGQILIDDVPTTDMEKTYVRSLFGMVLQDTWLFEGSLRENLKYSAPNTTDEEMIRSTTLANVHHFITTLPGNYDMILKEETMVSQGQKQLLTIARAMIQGAPMLILDEATSSVDTRTEQLIQSAMDRLTKDRTSFVIAHRLSTIRNADQIIVMDKGAIVETGTHDELLDKGGFYAKLYASQFDDKNEMKE